MDVRGKLVELLAEKCMATCKERGLNVCSAEHCNKHKEECTGYYADHLIANGVTVQEWISASEPPTRKDADKYGRVLAMEMGMMALVNYKGPINYPDRFPYWMPLPQPPKGE